MYTKFVLYTGLAIVSYLLLLAWNEDYPRMVEDSDNASVLTSLDVPQGSIDLPDSPAASATGGDDIPVAVPEPRTTANSTPELSPAPSSQLISVTTDNFTLQISPAGGDIVYLALNQHLRHLDEPAEPFVLLESGTNHLYVAESGLIGPNGIDKNGARANYRSGANSYQLGEGDAALGVDLTSTDEAGVEITKRFTFHRDSYAIDVSYLIDNSSASPWQANMFGQLRRSDFPDPSDIGGFGRTFLGFATTSPDDHYIKYQFDDVDDGIAPLDNIGGWIAFSQHYFVSAWVPDQSTQNNISLRRNNSNQYFGTFVGSQLSVPPMSTGTVSARLYAGPTDQQRLRELAENLNLVIDYGWLGFLASPIYWLLTHIEPVVGNYGVAIILLTLLVKSVFYKLTETQYRSMAGMRRVMPKMQQLKESYGDDKMKLQKATMELYKKEKINPFGGCLPMLVQMPVFIALYWMLMRSVELRHAPFILWINDLSVPDPFFVLPLLMGASMFAQTMLSPAPADPMQAKVMKFMPVMMTVFFLWFPAGLVLYWLCNSCLSIAQQWYITRKIEAAHASKTG